MPKIKSNSGAAKRFKKKSTKRKRHLRHQTTATAADAKLIQRMLPYA